MSHELSAHPCFDRHLPWEGPRGSEPPPRACWEHTAGPAGHPGPGPETSLPLRELGGRRRATSLHFLTVKKGTKPMGAGTSSGSFSELVRPCASWTVYTASICATQLAWESRGLGSDPSTKWPDLTGRRRDPCCVPSSKLLALLCLSIPVCKIGVVSPHLGLTVRSE